MAFRKQKSRKQQAAELAADYLKVKAVDQDGQGRRQGRQEGAKGTASTRSRRRSGRKRIPIVWAGVAALAAVMIARSRSGGEPSTA